MWAAQSGNLQSRNATHNVVKQNNVHKSPPQMSVRWTNPTQYPQLALKSANQQEAQKSTQSPIPGPLRTPLGAKRWPLGFQRRVGRLLGADGVQKSLTTGSHRQFPMTFSRHHGTWKPKRGHQGGLCGLEGEGTWVHSSRLSSYLVRWPWDEQLPLEIQFCSLQNKERDGRVCLTTIREGKALIFSSKSGAERRMRNWFQSPVAPSRAKSETSISHCAPSVTMTALRKAVQCLQNELRSSSR